MEDVEAVESPVDPIRFPDMRAEVVLAVKSLADPDYQQRVWIRHEYPHEGFYDDFTQNVHILFDDTCVLPEPHQRVGSVLFPNEVDVMKALGDVLDPLIDELGDASDAQYLAHPQWTEVVHRASNAYQVLHANDQR
ncbi:hypothetical protein GCM10011581_12400 [Saccharopolyspora subtropica]|uniref:Uncharacterized protein n=1 Tax=Saccharopolyspora thermophila TaxID=89367 RepID=A0A917JMQ2_9PSEU|nr:hypothetical protein [Saccharopolyspora subtropica]GGI76806.1 hypothetical protein GCM10011581_12400 [Saccharopolyspora subtropica]